MEDVLSIKMLKWHSCPKCIDKKCSYGYLLEEFPLNCKKTEVRRTYLLRIRQGEENCIPTAHTRGKKFNYSSLLYEHVGGTGVGQPTYKKGTFSLCL